MHHMGHQSDGAPEGRSPLGPWPRCTPCQWGWPLPAGCALPRTKGRALMHHRMHDTTQEQDTAYCAVLSGGRFCDFAQNDGEWRLRNPPPPFVILPLAKLPDCRSACGDASFCRSACGDASFCRSASGDASFCHSARSRRISLLCLRRHDTGLILQHPCHRLAGNAQQSEACRACSSKSSRASMSNLRPRVEMSSALMLPAILPSTISPSSETTIRAMP